MATPYSTCSSVIHDLQILRDVIGQSDGDRDKLLLQVMQACHIVAKFKAHLRELGAVSEAAIANLMAALEERTIISQGQGSLKELPSTMQPVLDNMRLYINERMKEFSEAQLQICQICAEIADNGLSIDSTSRQVNEPDLALSKMVELESHLRKDQREKVSGLGSLTPEVSEQAELEVERLNALKASKMKELFLKMQSELEEIYRGAHMDVDSDAAKQILIGLIESGNADMSDLLSSMDDQIAKAKEQVLSRKNVLALVEKWKYAAEEEKWLDDYEKDENRYKARGLYKNLEHAEKARIRVSKIPSIVETLTSRVKAWELEKGIPFLYDKDPLLPTLEEYTIRRQEREDEKRRYRVCLNPSTEHRSVDRVPTPCGHGVAWS